MDRGHTKQSLSNIFNECAPLQSFKDEILTMTHSGLFACVYTLQSNWGILARDYGKSCCRAVLLCMARYGDVLMWPYRENVLNLTDFREPCAASLQYRPTKKSTRQFVTNVLCLFRVIIIHENSTTLTVLPSDNTREKHYDNPPPAVLRYVI